MDCIDKIKGAAAIGATLLSLAGYSYSCPTEPDSNACKTFTGFQDVAAEYVELKNKKEESEAES